MLKKISAALLSLALAAALFCGCAENVPERKQLLYDSAFEEGFKILGIDASLDGNTAFGYIDYGQTGNPAILWRLAQWGTRFDLGASLESERQENGLTVYSNPGKEVAVRRGGGEIRLAVNGSNEYLSSRREGEAWPHLLIEQDLDSSLRLNEYKKIVAEIDFEISYVENKMSAAEYDPLLHTAQFQWIFSVSNRNPSTAGLKNDYLWFNLSYFDYREKKTETGGFFDGGKEDSTAKYIFSVGSEDLGAEVKTGERYKISTDILPLIKRAFDDAQDNGAMQGTLYEELGFGTMNIGWEIPGTFDCAVTIYSISLQGEK